MQIQNLTEQDLELFFHHAKLENWDIEEFRSLGYGKRY